MKREKKDKKDKKQQKSSSFFSNLNTDSTIEYGFAEKNPKSKWAKWTIVGLIGAATATGIAVPWALSSCTISLTKPYSGADVMYTYKNPFNNQWYNVTYDEFSSRVEKIQTQSTFFEKWDDVFYESTLKNLYNQEREAYLKFKAIYKKLHDSNPKEEIFGANLDTKYEDIEKEQRKILEENKKQFQKAVDGTSWYDLWIKELQTNSIYGPQQADEGSTNVTILEEKAIAYMVTQKIKSSALARYQGASISTTSWTYQDFQFANQTTTSSEQYTTYKNNEGVEVSVTLQDAVTTWKAYLTVGQNVVQPKNIDPTTNSKIAVFETKSYSVDYRNPVATDKLINIINNNFKFGLVSSFSISGITPGTKNFEAFTITSDALKSLFFVQNTNGTNSTQNFIPISQLSSFKGANVINASYLETSSEYDQNSKDDLLVKTFNTDAATNNQLGSSKVKEAIDLITAASSDSSGGADSSVSTQSKLERDDSSSSESSSTLNLLNLTALTASDAGATNVNGTENTLFSIRKENPITIFVNLLLTIAKSPTNEIDFSQYAYVGKNWEQLNYGTKIASPQLTSFIKLIADNIDPTTFKYNGKINAIDFNAQLENLSGLLSSNDLTFVGSLLNCVLIGDTTNIKTNYTKNQTFMNQVGYWNVYELSAPTQQNNNIGTYLHVSQSGLSIYAKNFNPISIDDCRKMVINDLMKTINVKEGETATLYYDMNSVFSKINNDNLIILNLLSDPVNVANFKQAIQKYLDKEINNSNKNTVDQIYNEFYNDVNLNFNSSSATSNIILITTLPTTIEKLVSDGRNYDFATIVDSKTGENLAAFQTQTLYDNNSIAKSMEQINSLFIQNVLNAISPTKKTLLKGGK